MSLNGTLIVSKKYWIKGTICDPIRNLRKRNIIFTIPKKSMSQSPYNEPCEPIQSCSSNLVGIEVQQNKRRSDFKKDEKKGTALLIPKRDFKKKKSKFKWLKQNSVNAIEGYHIQKAMSMDQRKMDLLCQIFGIVPACHANFQTFLLSIKNSDWETANAVHQAMRIVEECNNENELISPQNAWEIINQSNKAIRLSEQNKNLESKVSIPVDNLQMLKSFDLDIRYQIDSINQEIIINGPIDSTIQIHNNLDRNCKMIIQCFTFNNLPFWPRGLKITVNQDVVLFNSCLKSKFIDITNFLPKTIHVEYPCFSEIPCTLYVVKAIYRSYNFIIDEIKKRRNPSINGVGCNDTSFFDPVSGKIMKHPGKGINCTHNQCFDIKMYLKNANISRKFVCPICNTKLPIEELIYSFETEKQIKDTRSINDNNFDNLNLFENEEFLF